MNSDIGKRIVLYFANLFDWREHKIMKTLVIVGNGFDIMHCDWM